MSKDFSNQVKSGLGWDLVGSFFKQLSGLIVTAILARLLSPEEFGIIGLAIVFISLSQIFIDLGFTDSLVQKDKVSQKAYSSVFYISIGLGLVLGGIIFFLAPFIGSFFEKEVTTVLLWLSIIPIISSFGNVHNARFVKQMDFKTLAFRNIFSTTIGGIIGVIMAFLEYGVYALVAQQISTTLVYTIILWWKSDWKPSWVFSYKELKKLLNFSVYVFLDNVLQKTFQKIDTLFIGKYFSTTTLGFYSKAESLNAQIMRYTTSSLRKVLFPAFSQLQNNTKLFEASYIKVFGLASFLGALASGCLFFLSEDIIILLYGSKWMPSVLIFQILVFRLILSPFGGLMGKSLLAMGYSKNKFQIGQINRFILLSPIVVGYIYGNIHAFALALVIASFVGFVINLWAVDRYLHISFSLQLKKFFKPLLPLAIIIFIYEYYQIGINSILLFLFFLIIQLSYSLIIKDAGMFILINQLKILKNK